MAQQARWEPHTHVDTGRQPAPGTYTRATSADQQEVVQWYAHCMCVHTHIYIYIYPYTYIDRYMHIQCACRLRGGPWHSVCHTTTLLRGPYSSLLASPCPGTTAGQSTLKLTLESNPKPWKKAKLHVPHLVQVSQQGKAPSNLTPTLVP